jgi:hypothetical protein
MWSIERQYNLQDKARDLRNQLDSCLLAANNISEYIDPLDERDKQNLSIMKYHIGEVSSFLYKLSIAENLHRVVTTKDNTLQIPTNQKDWNDITPDGSIIYEMDPSITKCDTTNDDAECEHEIIIDVDTRLECLSKDMFLKNIKNMDTFADIKFYMNCSSNQPSLYIYKYINDDTEYYIGDNKCIYTIKDSVLVVHDKYTSVQSTVQCNKPKRDNTFSKSRGNVNRRSRNKKKYANFIMRDYFIFRHMDESDGYKNYDKYKHIQFCFVPDKHICASAPFLLYQLYLVGDDKRLYAIDEETNNILDVHSGQQFWQEVESSSQ